MIVIDKSFAKLVLIGAFVGIIIGLATSLLPSESASMPIMAGFLSALVVIFISMAFTGASGIGDSLMGMGRKIDDRLMETMNLESVIEKARRAVSEQRYEDAIETFTDVLYSPHNPSPDRTAFEIARIFEDNLSNVKEAIYWYRKAIGLSRRRGDGKSNSHYARESQASLEQLEKLLPQQNIPVKDLLFSIKEQIEKEEFQEADEKLQQIQMIHPDNSEVDYLFGHLYLFKNNMGMAIEHFERSLAKDPKHLLASFFHACTLQDFGHLLQARDSFRHYLSLSEGVGDELPRIEQAVARLSQIETELENPVFDTSAHV